MTTTLPMKAPDAWYSAAAIGSSNGKTLSTIGLIPRHVGRRHSPGGCKPLPKRRLIRRA
jgi:hypothetical protein